MKPMRYTKPGSVPTRLLNAIHTAGPSGLTRQALRSLAGDARETTLRDELSRLNAAGKVFAAGSHANRRWFWEEADALIWDANRPRTQHEIRVERRGATAAQKAERDAARLAKLAQPRGPKNAWSPEHLQILRDLYTEHGPQIVAEKTGRSMRAVKAKACALGIKSKRGAGWGVSDKPRNPRVREPKPRQIKPPKSVHRKSAGPTVLVLPASVRAPRPRGPADMPGEPIFTEHTKWTIVPTPPPPTRTNTYSFL